MKRNGKSESPYFKKRDSFQSPEFSTVFEVNPSCESDESILEKIIFPDQKYLNKHFNIQRYTTNKRQPLKEKTQNYNKNDRKYGKLNKNYQYLDKIAQPQSKEQYQSNFRLKQNLNVQNRITNQYLSLKLSTKNYDQQKFNISPRYRLNSLSSQNSYKNLNERGTSERNQKLLTIQSNQIKKNYSTEKYSTQTYTHQQNLSSVIDEKKLQQIQQKIRKFQQKNIETSFDTNSHDKIIAKKASFRDTMESQLSNIKIDFLPHQKLKKKQTIIDNISFGKENFNHKFEPSFGDKTNIMTQAKIDQQFSTQKVVHQTKNIDQDQKKIVSKCLQKIYSLVLVDGNLQLSCQNIILKLLSVEQVKLILGPIFTEVKIQNKVFKKFEFIQKALELVSNYKSQEIQMIIKLFIRQTEQNNQHRLPSSETGQNFQRVPGKFLSVSKLGPSKQEQKIRSKRSQSVQNQSHQNFFTSKRPTQLKKSDDLSQKDITRAKVTKNVYIEPTEKTQIDEVYVNRYPQKYEKEIKMTQKALELMLTEQKSKRYVSNNRNQQKIMPSETDEELQRLKNLERRFNEHFNNRI